MQRYFDPVLMTTGSTVVFILLMSGASPTRRTPVSVHLSLTKTEWGHPPTNCPLILDIDNATVYQEAVRAMVAAEVSTAWLPIKRVDLDGWWWTSGDFYGTQISSREWVTPGMDCAVLRSLDKIMDDVFCDRVYGYYMCEAGSPEGSSICDISAFTCFNVSGTVYNLYNGSGTWYNAAERCYSKGQTLAAFKNAELRSTLDIIAKHTNKWANIWVGLRKRVFVLNSTWQATIFKWGKNQPERQEDKNCVVANRTRGNIYEWATTNCNESHLHLCRSEMPTRTTGNGKPLDESRSCLQNRTTMATFFERSINGWKSATIALIVFILLIAVCLIFKGRRRVRRKKGQETIKAVPPVSIPLLAVTGSRQNPDKESPKGEDKEVPLKKEQTGTKETQASLSHMLERYLTVKRSKDNGGCQSWNITWSEDRWVHVPGLSKKSNAVLVVCESSKGKYKLFVQNDEANESLYENNIDALKFEIKTEGKDMKVIDSDINKTFNLGFKTSDDRSSFKDCIDLLRALRLVMS